MLRSPGARPKELSLGKGKSGTSSVFTALVRDLITPPINADLARVLHTEEDDDGRDTNGSRPRSTEHIVVLGPASEVAALEPDHCHESNRDLRPNVCEIVGCPGKTAIDDSDGVDLTEPLLLGEGAGDVVKDGRNDETDGEANEECSVQPSLAEYLVRTKSTPEYGCGEESVVSRAVEAVRCAGGTDILDVDLEVEDTSADDGRYQACNHLGPESVTRGNLGVVSELQIVQELNGVCTSDVSESLEEVHGERISLHPSATNELGQDVEGDWDTSDSSDDTDGDNKD